MAHDTKETTVVRGFIHDWIEQAKQNGGKFCLVSFKEPASEGGRDLGPYAVFREYDMALIGSGCQHLMTLRVTPPTTFARRPMAEIIWHEQVSSAEE